MEINKIEVHEFSHCGTVDLSKVCQFIYLKRYQKRTDADVLYFYVLDDLTAITVTNSAISLY